MKKKIDKLTDQQLMNLGFVLLIPGMFFTVILGDTLFFQVCGLMLLLLASAVFGAYISAVRSSKKK